MLYKQHLVQGSVSSRFDMFVAAVGWHLRYFSSVEHGQFKGPNKPKMDTPFLESNHSGIYMLDQFKQLLKYYFHNRTNNDTKID